MRGRTQPAAVRRRRSTLYHVAEDALEIGVEGPDLEQAGSPIACDGGECTRQGSSVARVELEHIVAVESHADGGPGLEQRPPSSRGRSVRTRTLSGRSSMSARNSWKSPAAASLPCDMTRIWEPSRSTSSST